MSTVLDKFDRQILAAVQADCRTPAETIAQAVGLSATAVQRRLRRLREAGVIRAEVAVLDPAPLGFGVTALIEVELAEASREALIEGFKQRMSAHPQVQQCFYVAGQADFVLIVQTPTLADVEQLSRALFFDDPTIRKFRTTFVLESVKSSLALALDPSQG